MSRARRRVHIGPPFAVVGTAALLTIAAATLSAAPPPPAAAAAACSSSPAAAVRSALSSTARAGRARIADRLGTRGQFIGRQIEIASAGGSAVQVTLPAESSVTEPSPGLVLYTRISSGRSEVRLIDAASGCDYLVAEPAGIVRSAVLDGTGTQLYVHAVSVTGRGDTGISRYALSGGPGTIVVPPLPADARYGPTFGTQLSWSGDHATLIVQSCGFEACRTRLFDLATSAVETIDGTPHGEVVGVTPSHLVAFGPCTWSPCEVLSIARQSGAVEMLAHEAVSARLEPAPDGATRVVIGTTAGTVEVTP